MDKEKRSRLDDERQQRRQQRAEEALRHLEEVGKQTQQMLRDHAASQRPDRKVGGLSRVLFETAIGERDPGDARRARGPRSIEPASAMQVDHALRAIRHAVAHAAIAGFRDGPAGAARSVHDSVERITAVVRGHGAASAAAERLRALMHEEERESQAEQAEPHAELEAEPHRELPADGPRPHDTVAALFDPADIGRRLAGHFDRSASSALDPYAMVHQAANGIVANAMRTAAGGADVAKPQAEAAPPPPPSRERDAHPHEAPEARTGPAAAGIGLAAIAAAHPRAHDPHAQAARAAHVPPREHHAAAHEAAPHHAAHASHARPTHYVVRERAVIAHPVLGEHPARATPVAEYGLSPPPAGFVAPPAPAPVDVAARAPLHVQLPPVVADAKPPAPGATQPTVRIGGRGEAGPVPALPEQVHAPHVAPPPHVQVRRPPPSGTGAPPPRPLAPLPGAAGAPATRDAGALDHARDAAGRVRLAHGTVAPLPGAGRPPAAEGSAAAPPIAAGAGGMNVAARQTPAPHAPALPSGSSGPAAPAAPVTPTSEPPAPDVPPVHGGGGGGDSLPDPASMVQQSVSLAPDQAAAQSSIQAEAQTQSRVPPQAQAQKASQVTPLGPVMATTARSADAPMASSHASSLAQGASEYSAGHASETEQASSESQRIAAEMAGAAAERARYADLPPPSILQQTAPSFVQPIASAVGGAVQAAASAVAAMPAHVSPSVLARGDAAAATPSTLPPFDAARFHQIDHLRAPLPPLETGPVDQAHAAAQQTYGHADAQTRQLAAIPAPHIAAPAAPIDAGDVPTRASAIAGIERAMVERGSAQLPGEIRRGAAGYQHEMASHVAAQRESAGAGAAERVAAAHAQAHEVASRPPPITGAQAAAEAHPGYEAHQAAATAAHEHMRARIAGAQSGAQGEVQVARGERDAEVAHAHGQYASTVQGQVLPRYAAAHAAAGAHYTASKTAAQSELASQQQAAHGEATAQAEQARSHAESHIAEQHAQLTSQQQAAYASHRQQAQRADQQHEQQMQTATTQMDTQVQSQQSQMQSQVASRQATGQQQVDQHLQDGQTQYHAHIAAGVAQANARRAAAQAQANAAKAKAAAAKKKHHGGGIFGAISSFVSGLVDKLLDLVKSIISAAVAAITSIMNAARAAAVAALDAARAAAMAALSAAKAAIQGIIAAAAAAIRALIAAAAALIKALIQALAAILQALVQELTALLTALVQAFKLAIDGILLGLAAALSVVDRVLGTHLAQAVNNFRHQVDAAANKLSSDIQRAGQAVEHGIQSAAGAACALVDAAAKQLDHAVTTIEHALDAAVDEAYRIGAGAIHAAFDAATAVVNTAFHTAEAMVKEFAAVQIAALGKIQQGVHAVARFVADAANLALAGIDKIAQGLVDLIPNAWVKAFVDFWNGPWRQIVVIGLATVAAVAITGVTLGAGAPLGALLEGTVLSGTLGSALVAGTVGGTLAGAADFGGELVAREGDIKLSSDGHGIYIPGYGNVELGADGKPIPPKGLSGGALAEFEQQAQWATSNFHVARGPDGRYTFRRKSGEDIGNAATAEGIKGFGEGFISGALAAGSVGLGARVAGVFDLAGQSAGRLAVESTVANVVTGPAQQSLSSAWDAGFTAIKDGRSPIAALRSAFEAGKGQLASPTNWLSSMAMMGIAPAKLKLLTPLLGDELKGVDSRVLKTAISRGADVTTDTLGQTFAQAGGNFVGTYAAAIASGKSPGEALREARAAADSSFSVGAIASTLATNTAGSIAGPEHGGHVPLDGELGTHARGVPELAPGERPSERAAAERAPHEPAHRATPDEHEPVRRDRAARQHDPEPRELEPTITVHHRRSEDLVDSDGTAQLARSGARRVLAVHSGFDVRRVERGGERRTELAVRLHLQPGEHVTPEDVARVKERAAAGVDHYYNVGHRLPNGDRLHVAVEFVDDPGKAHLEVALEPGHDRADQATWYVGSDAATYAHEVGHQLGFLDEYFDRQVANRRHADSPDIHHDGSLMGAFRNADDSVQEGTGLRERHLEQLLHDIEAARGEQPAHGPTPAPLRPTDTFEGALDQLRHADPATYERLRRLPAHELEALYEYTHFDYVQLNAVLRGDLANTSPLARLAMQLPPGDPDRQRFMAEYDQALPHYLEKVRRVSAALAQFPSHDGTSYRTIHYPVDSERFRLYTTVGAEVSDPAFVSTSADASYQRRPDDNLRIEIRGTTGKRIDALSSQPGEHEVLFQPGTRFRVTRVEQRGARWHVVLSELPGAAGVRPAEPTDHVEPQLVHDADQLHRNISQAKRYDIVKDFPVKQITSAPGHHDLRSPEAMVGMARRMAERNTSRIFDGNDKIQLNVFTRVVDRHVEVRSIEVQDGNHRLAAGLHAGKWNTIADIPREYLDIEVNGYDTHGVQHPRWIPLEVARESALRDDQWFEVPEEWGPKGPTAQVSGGVSSQDAVVPEQFRGVPLDEVVDRSLERVAHARDGGGDATHVAEQRPHEPLPLDEDPRIHDRLPWEQVGADNAAAYLRELEQAGRAQGKAAPPRRAGEHRVAMPFGAEFELAFKNPMYARAHRWEVPDDAYRSLLAGVNRALGQDAGTIEVTRETDGSPRAVLTDKQGRTWLATGEYVDTGRRRNGVELVTPGLGGGGVELLQRVRREIAGDAVPGIRSSSHLTFDVSKLVGRDGDARRLVQAILHIENHLPEIYAAAAPQRYGTTVNRFGVPLGVNQRDLLRELAALPDTSIEHVQAVFAKHAARDMELTGKDTPYKYRAANYGKLFGDEGGPRLLEFRIPDLMSEDDVPRIHALLQSVIENGAARRRAPSFDDRFRDVPADLKPSSDPRIAERQLAPVNRVVREVSDAEYATFLRDHKLDPRSYPKLGGKAATNGLRLSESELAELAQRIDITRPIAVKGGHLSFGFEAEFRSPPDFDPARYHYLDVGSDHVEGTGNREFASIPTETMAEALGQMQHLKRGLAAEGGKLRSFHFTIQAPREAIEAIGDSRMRAWSSRIGDVIQAWRLAHKANFFALNTWSQTRTAPRAFAGHVRGSLRQYDLYGGRHRIELRGYMDSPEAIEGMARKIAVGLARPSLVRGFDAQQAQLFAQHPKASLEQLLSAFEGRELDEREQHNLRDMVSGIQDDSHILPLMGYESMPYLTPEERIKFGDATQEFLESARLLMQRPRSEDERRQHAPESTLPPLTTPQAFGSRFRKLIETWSRKVDLHRVLNETVLTRPRARERVSPLMFDKLLSSTSPLEFSSLVSRIEPAQLRPLLRSMPEAQLRHGAMMAELFPTSDAPHLVTDFDNELTRRGLPRATPDEQRRFVAEVFDEARAGNFAVHASHMDPAHARRLLRLLDDARLRLMRTSASPYNDEGVQLKAAIEHELRRRGVDVRLGDELSEAFHEMTPAQYRRVMDGLAEDQLRNLAGFLQTRRHDAELRAYFHEVTARHGLDLRLDHEVVADLAALDARGARRAVRGLDTDRLRRLAPFLRDDDPPTERNRRYVAAELERRDGPVEEVRPSEPEAPRQEPEDPRIHDRLPWEQVGADNAGVILRDLELAGQAQGRPAIPREHAAAGHPVTMPFGAELELAFKNPMYGRAYRWEVPDEAYHQLLSGVNRALGDDAGSIEVTRNEDGSPHGVLTDRQGRRWIATGEYVDTGRRMNGVELVSPALHGGGVELLQRVRREIAGDAVPGIRSSSHVTFDVSHLVGPDGDATRLVDAILHIENHLPEIYAAAAPQRYGTTVNRFGVPLGVNQRDLLRELAALPTKDIASVEAVFARHADRDMELTGKDTPYKYRAANYGKLFGEAGGPRLLEFRIPDLLREEDIPRTHKLLQAVIERGSAAAATPRFANPFRSADRDLQVSPDANVARRQLEPINRAVAEVSDARYHAFLDEHELDRAAYPKLGGEAARNALRLQPAEVAELVRAVDTSRPIEVKGGRLSFGFEAEFRSPRDFEHARYPYLDPNTDHTEGASGNRELASRPTETMAEALAQMAHFKRTVAQDGGKLRSFHFTIQAPRETIEDIGDDRMSSWASRLIDTIQAWRLNKSHYFGLNVGTQARRPPHETGGRGTLRQYDLRNGRHRIELRGFMSATSDIEAMAKKIITGLQRPELIRGFEDQQRLISGQHPDATLIGLMRAYEGRDLTDDETRNLYDMLDGLQRAQGLDKHVLPLVGYDAMPYVTPQERVHFHDATREFLESARLLMHRPRTEEERPEGSSLPPLETPEAFGSRFRKLIQDWAAKVQLHRVLDESVLIRPGAPEQLSPTSFDKLARRPLEFARVIDRYEPASLQAMIGALSDAELERAAHSVRFLPSGGASRHAGAFDRELERRGLPAPDAARGERFVADVIAKFGLPSFAQYAQELPPHPRAELLRLVDTGILRSMRYNEGLRDPIDHELVRRGLEPRVGIELAQALRAMPVGEARALMQRITENQLRDLSVYLPNDAPPDDAHLPAYHEVVAQRGLDFRSVNELEAQLAGMDEHRVREELRGLDGARLIGLRSAIYRDDAISVRNRELVGAELERRGRRPA